VHLICTAALSSGECILPKTMLQSFGVNAQLHEEQISIGVIALAQTCCAPDLHSSTDQWGVHFAKNSVAVL